MTDEQRNATGAINSYALIEELSKRLPDDAIVVTDAGTAYTCTWQAAKMKPGQRWIFPHGHAQMGSGLPLAIGAAFATGRKVVCIVGDGGLQMNIQELATIAHYKLPILIFVLNNGGYLTMRHTFSNHYGRETGCGPESGLSFPNLRSLAKAYGIPYRSCLSMALFCGKWDGGFSHAVQEEKRHCLYEIGMPHDQPLIPRSTSLKRPDSSIVSRPLEDMFPLLPRDELMDNMLIPLVDALE